MMYVKSIEYVSGTDGDASVTISDGKYDIICFCYECHYHVSEIVESSLDCFDTSCVQIAENMEYAVQKRSMPYAYFIQGMLVNHQTGIVKMGKIPFHINPKLIPKDISDRAFICFVTSRVDLRYKEESGEGRTEDGRHERQGDGSFVLDKGTDPY